MNAQQARAFLRWAKRVQRVASRVAGRECQRLADGVVAQLGMLVEIVPGSDCYRDYQGRPLRITSLLGRNCSLVQLGPIQVHTTELRSVHRAAEVSTMDIDELRAWAQWALTDKHEKADGAATLARITIAVLDERERDKARIAELEARHEQTLIHCQQGRLEEKRYYMERIDAALEAVADWSRSEPGSAANGYMMRVKAALTKP